MGSNSGSVMASVPGSSFASSTASGSNFFNKSGMGTSSSVFSNKFSGSLGSLGYADTLEKYRLLDDTINNIFIGVEPLGKEIGHNISYYTAPFRFEIPSHLGWGKEPSYKNYIHYVYDPVKERGLRFSKMDINYYFNEI